MGIKSINRIAVVAHWIIMALCVYAVFCCGFHLLPVWGYSENYETINATWLSIALSYIVGYVIYLFTSSLPRKQRENEVFALWEPHLTKLYNEMSERIEEVRAKDGNNPERSAGVWAKTDKCIKKEVVGVIGVMYDPR